MQKNETLFSGLSESDKKIILDQCQRRQVRKRQVIVHQGDSGRDMYIIVSGRLRVSALSDEGKEISFVVLGENEYFGELSLLDGRKRSATVTAVADSELLVLTHQQYQNLLTNSPQTATRLLTRIALMLADRLRATDSLYQDVVFLDVSARLAKFLLSASVEPDDVTSSIRIVDVKLSQYELGTLVNASRESVNKQLRDWESRDILNIDNGRIILRDIDALQSLACGE